jgi:hypothetical protein
MKEFASVIRKMLGLSVTAKIEHLNAATTSQSYAAHKAFGEFYKFLDEFNDRVIEHCIGMGYMLKVEAGILELPISSAISAPVIAKELYDISEGIEDEALCNMCADLFEAIGDLKYMMKFK